MSFSYYNRQTGSKCVRFWCKEEADFMKRMPIYKCLILSFFVFFPGIHALSARTITIAGKVTEKGTVNPVPGAVVMYISDTADTTRATTDSEGEYDLVLDISSSSVEEISRPEGFELFANYPNPFNPSTTIEYKINRAGRIRLTIFSITGQTVCRLVDGYQNTGTHRIIWNGKDDNGRGVAAGVYLYQLKMGTNSATKKMLLLDGSTWGGLSNGPPPVSKMLEKALKTTANEFTYKVSIKHEGFVTYEDYGFTATADTLVNISLDKKSGATLYGSFEYSPCTDCRTDNWNGIIDPITIIVYDTNDYTTKLSMTTIEYPDTTFEITGLPECSIIDFIIEGDDVISYKKSEIAMVNGDVIFNEKYTIISILYNQDASIRPYIHNKIFYIKLKKDYNNFQTAEQIFLEYGCDNPRAVGSGEDPSYYGTIPDDNPNNSAQLVRLLNHDQKISYSGVGSFLVSAK